MINATDSTGSATKARLNPGRQWIGIRNLTIEERFQPRARLDKEWAHDLSGFRKDGSEFPPAKVYQTPDGRLLLAGGHHRALGMEMAGEDSILCDVVNGTEEDAIVFAAGSNKGNGVKPMGPKDITKAVEMLLAIDAWWNKSDTLIGNHVGCGHGKIKSIRMRIHARDNRELPATIVTSAEVEIPYQKSLGTKERKISKTRWRTGAPGKNEETSYRYQATYKGKGYIGKTEDEVRSKLQQAMATDERKLSANAMRMKLANYHGFSYVFPKAGVHFRGITGLWRPGIFCVPTEFVSVESLPAAIGQLVAARCYKDDSSARLVVVCYPKNGQQKVIDLYRHEGFEFLTPDELIESLKAD